MAPSTSKTTPSQRRAPSSLSKVSTPPTTARSNKSSKPSLVIRFNLPNTSLRRFPHDTPSPPEKDRPKDVSAPLLPETKPVPPTDASSQASGTSTPQPTTENQSTTKSEPKTDSSTPKTGVKRELGAGVSGEPKPKGRPGPKKKNKLEGTNGTNDVVSRRTGTGAAHKLGPKANQGAINAGLRALDRTGTPCRKWSKGGFKLKSFTGHSWALPSWSAPVQPVKPESSTTQDNSESKSASKDLGSNSNVDSDSTPNGVNGINGVSSPALPLAMTA